jgi:prevent-host-death family protein
MFRILHTNMEYNTFRLLVMEQYMSRTQLDESIDAVESFTITEFKERAREVIDLVEDHKAVAILRHKMPDAVLISASDYVEYVKLRRERLNFLTQRYDDMVARMQTPEAVAGVDALFSASSEELGSAAVAAAKRG